MRKKISKVLLAGLLVTSASYAESNDHTFDSNSLIGIEGGMGSFETQVSATTKKKEDFNMAGFKIGAETHNVRMFLSARQAFMSSDNFDYDKAYMYGAELQYKFNMMDSLNFFVGVNYGKVSFEFNEKGAVTTATLRQYSTKYKGGDVGFNYHINDMFDVELGARLMTLDDDTHTLGGVTYTFDDITTGYMSIILKYQMD